MAAMEIREPLENILDYLERTEEEFRYRTAVEDDRYSLTYHELAVMARRIGSALGRRTKPGSPVPVMMEKSPVTLAVMLGIVYAGCFYVPVNPANPEDRQKKILEVLQSPVIITDAEEQITKIAPETGTEVVTAEQLLTEDVDAELLRQIRIRSGKADVLYALFTSGSTGIPKAVMVTHEAVIRFIGHFTQLFGISGEDVIGNQAPFDFDVSVKDIYSCIMTGAKLVLIPKEYFSTPPRLLDYLCEKNGTTLTWAVSALTLVSSLKGLDYRVPSSVKRVLFSGEAMPPKQLRIWQKALPEAMFVNLYGPTEITCNCTYYIVTREYGDNEKIPAGKAFPGRTVFLRREDGSRIVSAGETGEICVAGESLAKGYYRDEVRTAERFVTERAAGASTRFYKTGDLASYDEKGNIIFAGRRDFQIKHMGHRIELEEIESAMNAVDKVNKSCCVFDRAKNRIVGFYMGSAEPSSVRRTMKKKLPVYMIPSKLCCVPAMPLNKNGKTDRAYFMRLTQEKL